MTWKLLSKIDDIAFYEQPGQNIHHLRKTLGITQEELSRRVDCSQKYVSKIESGQARPSALLCVRIATALQCSADALFVNILSCEQTEGFIISALERKLTDEVLRAVTAYLQREK